MAGLLVEAGPHRWGPRQATVITLEALSLWLSWLLRDSSLRVAGLFVTLAAGLQNGSTGNLPSLALRTCNVTGFAVEIGMSLGLFLRERFVCSAPAARLWLWVPLLASFFVGAILGSQIFLSFGASASLGTAACLVTLTALGSFLYLWARHRRKQRRHAQRQRRRQEQQRAMGRPMVVAHTHHHDYQHHHHDHRHHDHRQQQQGQQEKRKQPTLNKGLSLPPGVETATLQPQPLSLPLHHRSVLQAAAKQASWEAKMEERRMEAALLKRMRERQQEEEER